MENWSKRAKNGVFLTVFWVLGLVDGFLGLVDWLLGLNGGA
jgi:hypothetical protein